MPRFIYAIPALIATPVTILLAIASLSVGPTHACEECPGDTGASPAQTDQWLWALGVSVLAIFVAWLVAVIIVVGTGRDGPRSRAAALALSILAALTPVAAAGTAVAINAHNAAHPAGYRS